MSKLRGIAATLVIAERYRTAVESGDLDKLAELYHPQALLDAHVPNWRFQIQGREMVARAAATALPGPGRFTAFNAESTVSGDLLVQFEWQQADDQGGQISRELHMFRLDNDRRITEQILFCAGIWDQQLRSQMAEEAPLIRPRPHDPAPHRPSNTRPEK
jgi:hypothetical protein